MALRAASADDATVRPEFVDDLHRRLAQELGDRPAAGTIVRIPRRAVLEAAGAVAAAGVALAVDRTVFAPPATPGPPEAASTLVPDRGVWHPVVARAALQSGEPFRFQTASTVAFVTDAGSGPRAVSGVCTHLGCLLQANRDAARLDCPCHRAAFGFDGRVLFAELPVPPASLPQLATRVRNGTVEVLVPRSD